MLSNSGLWCVKLNCSILVLDRNRYSWGYNLIMWQWLILWTLTHWSRDKMAASSQTTLCCQFTDYTFKRILVIESFRILFKISLQFVPKGPINNISALIQIMPWRWPGDKQLSEPMMVRLSTHICVIRPQRVNSLRPSDTIWQHRSGSTLAQVMACCLTAPSHYLNQYWLISKVYWHSSVGKFIRDTSATIH